MHFKNISALLTVTNTPQVFAINDDICEVVCFTGTLLVTVDGMANPMVLPAGSSRVFEAAGISLVRSGATDATAQVLIGREDRG